VTRGKKAAAVAAQQSGQRTHGVPAGFPETKENKARTSASTGFPQISSVLGYMRDKQVVEAQVDLLQVQRGSRLVDQVGCT
jgi:hypothetical protein